MLHFKLSHRTMSFLLCVALLLGCLPLTAFAATPHLEPYSIVGSVTDPGTADSWEQMMGLDTDGNRYAGRVWVDKSVYKDGDIVTLNSRGEAGSSFQVTLEDDEAFQIVFSALGSTMASKESVISSGPMDVVLILDTSTSMDDVDSQGVTRLERTIEAANALLENLLTLKDVRIGLVTYNANSETVLPLDTYANGIELVVTDYFNNGSSDAGVVHAYDRNRTLLGKDSGYTMGTNLQDGIDRGFNLLANASAAENRSPVAIVLADGQANRASSAGFYELSNNGGKSTNASGRNLYLGTLLNAAYNKTKIEARYGREATVYTVGVDVANNRVARLLMDPSDTTYGFNSTNSEREIREAYKNFQTWANGQNVTYSGWAFNHNYPTQNGAVTAAKIAANINYADTYYDVSNDELADTFHQIYEELSSGAFNPISSSTSVAGGTGVDDTPLIYVDFIGQYMEVKTIQSVSLFGASYGVIKNADGTYTVDTAIGINPATNEQWNTAEDIRLSLIRQEDGTQKLEIRINQEILPIILEQVDAETVGGETNATITEFLQEPLRVFYTVGVDSDVLLPNGKVDVTKIRGYEYIDDETGTISFYSNRFGVMNSADGNQIITNGDAHVGFQPSKENRYYYHQANQGIFTAVTRKSDGSAVSIDENNEYGILWNESAYDLTWMSYEAYQTATDDTKVYTYVTFFRPTLSYTDAPNAAEEVTYLVCTDWAYLKESVAFYDAQAQDYLNAGAAIPVEQVASVVNNYLARNPGAELYAVLGVGSHRTSRLHNMTVEKTANPTATATQRYAPEYTYSTASVHNGNSVVVWLGNNGKLTVEVETGIALTKAVTEAFGDADDTYPLTVTVPQDVVADPFVFDGEGNSVAFTYENNLLTVHVKAGQTVYVSGIPGGTVCEIGEIVDGDYYIADKTDTVTIPLVSEAVSGGAQYVPAVVTNAPYKYGNLYITKEITAEHAVPASVLDTAFEMIVDLGVDLAGKTFSVEDSAHSEPYNVTVGEDGRVSFRIKARQTIEILRLPANTTVTVTEATPPSCFTVSYRTRNHSGETADTDNVLKIPSDGSATAVVLNHYVPAPVSVDLNIAGTKNFIVEGAHSGGTFVYQVQRWNGTAWESIEGKTAQTIYTAGESGEKTFAISDVLAGVVYTEVGSHAYRVIEVKGDVANVTYDRTAYTFDVTVTDNGGVLVATVTDLNNSEITDGSYEVTFRNTYHTAPVSIDIIKEVDNRSGDTTVSKAGFFFVAVRTDADWQELTGDEASRLAVFSDVAGNGRFTATYREAGTYYYVISEVNGNAPGWSYSQAQYRVIVTVTENDGELTATLHIEKRGSQNAGETAVVDPADATKGKITFCNTYDPADAVVDLDGFVSKTLTGMTLQAEQFTFYVYLDGDRTSPVLVGTNNLNGDVRFVDFDEALCFDGVGIYRYDVVESIPTEAVYDEATGKYLLNGMRYDPTIYDLVVEVTNDLATGKLTASCYFEDSVSNVVTFHNNYQATPTSYSLGGVKLLHGRSPRAGEFSFGLYEGETLLETVVNKADGSFAFGTIRYTVAGIYTYTIKELEGSVAGVRYDGVDKPVTVTVTVEDQNGVLIASASVVNEDIKFENTYSANAALVTFRGTKKLEGADLHDDAFTFLLYKTDNSLDINASSSELLASTKNVDGLFSFARELSATGTYYFVIVEDTSAPAENTVYDRTAHKFAVQVSDFGDGQLQVVVTNLTTGISSASAASVSATVGFVNATFEEAVEKEVYIAGNDSAEIDGQKVSAGDILTYFITYTNYTGENVVVDIMDTIPAHTSYVESSASHNGTYAGAHVNWVLHVAKGESVTVTFDVRVDESEAIVANTAVVRDGTNTYHTNEVVNHTVENALKKDVFSPADLAVSIDGRKVYEGDELIYKITFTNITGSTIDLTITDEIPAYTTYVEDSADNGGVYADGVITWDFENLPAWSTVTVAFKVTVNDDLGAVTVQNSAKASDGNNSYETGLVTNYTVEDPVSKEVSLASDPSVSIDGFRVRAGDELIYTISYTNTAKETAIVTIIDKVPAYTDYVEGSADNNGVYAEGLITWSAEVAPGETLAVTFKVVVAEAEAATSIINQAEIKEGKNTYITNEVSTSVIPEEPQIPATGDGADFLLWIALLIFCGGAAVSSIISGKKKTLAETF